MNIYKIWTLICLLLIGAFATAQTNLYKQTDKVKMNQWVDSVYNSLTLDEKVGQLFMPIVDSKQAWRQRIAGYIQNQKIGGVLFSKGTLAAQAEMTNYAQSISKTPLFVALDGEWGLSMRLNDAPRYPRNQLIGAIQDMRTIQQYGKEVARQCAEMGIHINFAPSIDVNTNQMNPVIGTRSYGENPREVARQGIAFAKGMEENHVISVAKHFPGHGDTSKDSHHVLPSISYGIDRLQTVELFPFQQFVDAGLGGIMLGHLNVPALGTKGMPASLSKSIGEKLLKDEMGFSGLVFTDGMAMRGVSSQPDKSLKALLAGNDIIVGSVNLPKEVDLIRQAVAKGDLSEKTLEEKVRKILSYKFIAGVPAFKPITTSALTKKINAPTSEWIQREIYDKAITLLKNDTDQLPLRSLDKREITLVSVNQNAESLFSKWVKKYAAIKTINIDANYNPKPDETLIVSLNDKIDNTTRLKLTSLLKSSPQTILVIFDAPSSLSYLNELIDQSRSVILAYDNSQTAQMSAAQGLFGGIAFEGKLPVSIGKIKAGSGINTKKTRLAYSLPENVGIKSALLENIEHIAFEGIRQKAYPGCYVLVAKDGEVIYDRAFGNFDYSTLQPVTEETVYDLASVTKVTATLPALMKLYDEKKIKLQDNFGQFVPQTKGTNKAPITLREALFHESGMPASIPYYIVAIDKGSYTGPLFGKKSVLYNAHFGGSWGRTDYKFFQDLIAEKPSADYNLPVAKNMFANKKMHDKLLDEIVATPLKSKTYKYSCLNFMLLKEAVENVANTDLNTYLQTTYFKKLGATSTTFQPTRYMSDSLIAPTEFDPFFRKQQIKGYVHDEGAALFGGISGNAGLFSTANDLAKLAQLWLNGGSYGGENFLSPETVTLFTQSKSSRSRRGLGFDKPDPRNNNASPTSPLTPPAVYGHTGFTGTALWVDPDNNLVYIFLSNRVYPDRSPNKLYTLKIRERIQDEIYKALRYQEKK